MNTKTTLTFKGKPHIIPEGQKEFSIGRGDDRNLQVPIGDVSRIHCTLLLGKNGNYSLRDNGSKYGTSVRGKNISKDLRVELQDGDEIVLGGNGTTILVKIDDEDLGDTTAGIVEELAEADKEEIKLQPE